jgi:LacI family transcriptional regulator
MPSRPPKTRANLRDVAKTAGVSVATVSRVLNTPALVRAETRSRVEAVIEDLGFVRSAAARAINSGRTRILGALIPTLDNDIFSLTINAIENRLVDFGFSLVVATTDDDQEKEARKAQELLDIGVEGFFLTGVMHSDALTALLNRARRPAVTISCYDPSCPWPTIGYDNRHATRLAYDHLTDLGHQNIAVLHGPVAGNDRTQARLDAIGEEQGPRRHGFFETELSVAGGAQAFRRSAQEALRYDAYLCLSDVLAFGVLNEVQRQGLSVPQDVSVIGIHDLPASSETFPRLTTVHLPAATMGRHAAESLAQWVSDDIQPGAHYIEARLVERETTAERQS